MADTWSRFRLLLADSFVPIVAVLVVVALLGGWLTYTTHFTQDTHVENRTVADWESTVEFDHSATVVNGSGAFSKGTTLSNQSTYFSSITPVLNGTLTYSYEASAGDVEANATLEFVLHSVKESGGNVTEYWRITRQLDGEQIGSLGPSEPLRAAFSRNMSAMQQLASQIEEQIGGSPGTIKGVVVARVRTDGEIEGEQVSRTRRYTLPIEIEEGQYRVIGSETVSDSPTVTRRVRVANTPSQLRSTGSILLFVLPFGLLVGLVGARAQGILDLDKDERDHLETERAREEFEEWITTAQLPDAVLNAPQVNVASLEGLVDIAIDTNRRVIDDPDREGYFVLVDDVCYTYSLSVSEASDEFEREGSDTDREDSPSE